MQLADRLLEERIAIARGLGKHWMLRGGLDGALPAIDREARREHVDARRGAALDEASGERLGGRAIGQVSDDEQDVVRHTAPRT